MDKLISSLQILVYNAIGFENGADSVIFVNNLLNIHSDPLERVFSTVIRNILNGVQLQHYQGGNYIIPTDFVQISLEHNDFTDYLYSSRLVRYADFF